MHHPRIPLRAGWAIPAASKKRQDETTVQNAVDLFFKHLHAGAFEQAEPFKCGWASLQHGLFSVMVVRARSCRSGSIGEKGATTSCSAESTTGSLWLCR